MATSAKGFVLLLVSVSVVQGDNGWSVTYNTTDICAIEGSTVIMTCSYKYLSSFKGSRISFVNGFWFTRTIDNEHVDLKSDSQYKDRVKYGYSWNNECTLTITHVRKSDSGIYRFRFTTNHPDGSFTGKPGVTLNVTDDPDFQVVKCGTWLYCISKCIPPTDQHSYIWYKNGQEIPNQPSNYLFETVDGVHSYSCALRGHKTPRAPSVYAPRIHSPMFSPSGQIVEDSSVTLTCSSDANPAAHYTWYKGESHPEFIHDGPQLVFSSIQSSDSGKFYCRAENQLGSSTSKSIYVDVRYPPKMISVSVVPSGQIVENSSVTLTCSSDANPAAHYTWYKENQTLPQTSETIYFPSIQSSDRGFYSCRSENEYGHIESSISAEFGSETGNIQENYKLTVSNCSSDAPELPSVSVVPSGQIVEDSSVTLTCSSDANPAAHYTWYKRDSHESIHEGPQLVFSSIQPSDSGQFYCRAENQLGRRRSEFVSINVEYAPELPSVSVVPSGQIVENSSVTLTCSSDANPAAHYTWYKEDEESPRASGQSFTITAVRAEDGGKYFCEAWNSRGRRSSSFYLTVAAGKSVLILNIARLTLMVLMLIPVIVLSLWMRNKTTLISKSEGNIPAEALESESLPDYENITTAQTDDTEEQDDLV